MLLIFTKYDLIKKNSFVFAIDIALLFLYKLLLVFQWLFMPTAAAFLWCSPDAPSRNCLHHPIVSHSYTPSSGHQNDFVLPAECAMLGTRDYTPMLVAPAALAFAEVCVLEQMLINSL